MFTLGTWQELQLSGNHFIGTIPKSLGRLSNLQKIQLDKSGLSGFIPNIFGGMLNLQRLHLDGNTLSGSVPVSLETLAQDHSLTLVYVP